LEGAWLTAFGRVIAQGIFVFLDRDLDASMRAYASICTAASVLGGMTGYAIGYFLFI